MPLTVLVRSGDDANAPRLTFDGTQRVVIGRGAGCDVRLPDTSVSLRHASIQARGAEFALVDEGSTNGTYVGGVRLAPRTTRVLRSGDRVRVGRVWIEVRVDPVPVTRDLANATRDLALALVANAMRAAGDDLTMRVRVVEGADLDMVLPLEEEGRAYVIGRGEACDLPLADADASREHVAVERRGAAVVVRDLGAKNGAWIGETMLVPSEDFPWKPQAMLRIGRTVLSLEEPANLALQEIEGAPDEVLPPLPPAAPAPAPSEPPASAATSSNPPLPESSAPIASVPASPRPEKPRGGGWTVSDVLVMLAALSILGLSVAGLVWLLKG